MKASRVSFLLAAFLFTISETSPRPLELPRAQTKQVAATPCCAQSDQTQPREIDFPYYSLRDGLTATLQLVSGSPNPLDFVIALRSRSGQTVLAPSMTIQSQEKLPIDLGALLASLSADATGDFAEGSVAVYFNGTIMPLAGQLTMSDPKRRLSFESEVVDNSPGLGLLPPRLNGLWWGLGGGREATIAVTNTSGASVTADVFLDFLGKQHTSAPLVFSPHETKVLAIAQLLGDLEVSPSQAPEGGITIIPRGGTPSLVAQGKITDPATGFSTTLNFPDPWLQVSSALHASGVPIGVPAKGSPFAGLGAFVPHVIVRNLASTPQSVTVTVEYPAADGPQQIVLAPVALDGYATKDLLLDTALGLLPLPLPYCSIRIQYSGPPGSAMAEVSSIEARGDLVIDSRLANEGDGWAGSGAHPWHLDEETESILFLTNMGDRECPIGFRVQAGGVYYHVVDLSLRPHETKAIDLRKLRDRQKPDFRGSKIPAGATDGAVNWIRVDNVPVMGRLVVLQRHRGIASNYDCSACVCPASYQNLYLDPSSAAMLVGNAGQFTTIEITKDCNGYAYNIDVTASPYSTWSSSQPSYVSLDGSTKGLTHALAGGTSNIGDTFSNACVYQYYPPYPVCYSSCNPASGSSPATVCTLSIANPANGQVFDLTAGNYNQTTMPLTASSACPGTANWTLNFSYTSQASATYTSSSSTSSATGQTSNYQPPAGNGGQINLTANATLAGHSFTANSLAYVDGTAIPNATITSRLVSLYSSGATPHLLTGIAVVESNYRQFSPRSLYTVYGPWPLESPSPALGLYVGLMQVPNGMPSAFEWLTNTSSGASIFNGKNSIVQSYVSAQRNGHPSLPDLSATQYEDNQLVLYNGLPVPSNYVWQPNSNFTAWTQVSGTGGYNYVQSVRNGIQ